MKSPSPKTRYFITPRGISLFLIAVFIFALSITSAPLETLDAVLSFFVALHLIAFIWVTRSLQGVSVDLRIPEGNVEGHLFQGEVVVRNHTPLQKILLQVTYQAPYIEAPLKIRLARIQRGEEVRYPFSLRSVRRGIYPSSTLILESQDPMKFYQVQEIFPIERGFTVYPRFLTLTSFPLEAGGGSPLPLRPSVTLEGAGDEFIGLRPYAPGDPFKNIHWLTSARLGFPVVKQFLREMGGNFLIVVDVDPHQIFGQGSQNTLEIAIRSAASVAHYYFSTGALGSVYFDEPEGADFTLASGPASLLQAFQKLACIQGKGSNSFSTVLLRLLSHLRSPNLHLLVFSSRITEEMIPILHQLSSVLASLSFFHINPEPFLTREAFPPGKPPRPSPSSVSRQNLLQQVALGGARVYTLSREDDLLHFG